MLYIILFTANFATTTTSRCKGIMMMKSMVCMPLLLLSLVGARHTAREPTSYRNDSTSPQQVVSDDTIPAINRRRKRN